MKALIFGGGKGCRSLLSLSKGTFLRELKLDIQGVFDRHNDAKGMIFARELGLQTYTDMKEALAIPDIELIIELTGDDAFVEELYKNIKHGIKVIDHTFARIFWDLINAQEQQKIQLDAFQNLEKKLEVERHFLQGLFDSYSDLCVVMDKTGLITRANKIFYEFLSITPQDTIGKRCYDVLKDTVLDCEKEDFHKCLLSIIETEMPYTSIRRTQQPNESYWEITRTPIKDDEGKVEAILGIWQIGRASCRERV